MKMNNGINFNVFKMMIMDIEQFIYQKYVLYGQNIVMDHHNYIYMID